MNRFDSAARDIFIEQSFDLLAVVGTDGYFKHLNPAFERVLGHTREELLAKPLSHFLHPDDVHKTSQGIQVLAEGTARIGSINRYRCKDGSYRWFSWNTVPQGPLLYTIGRDITEQVKFEEKIWRLNLQLEQKNKTLEQAVEERMVELRRTEAQVQQLQKMDAIGRLAGGIAHDFNNMLGVVSVYADILWEDAANPEAVRAKVGDLREVIGRAAALTRQLLLFSRKQAVQPETIDVNPLIQRLEKMLRRLIGEHISIVTKLAADLKSIDVDPSQMEQVVLNLVVNARDAMPNGGTITLETSNVTLDAEFASTHLATTPGPYVMLSVTDTGTGMDEATRAKIFEPFFTTKAAGKGTGLGLATVYGIIKQNRGAIWVYSELGMGTVFKIYLPISEKIARGPEPVQTKNVAPARAQTILLVEDDENLRLGFASLLKRRGYQVLSAAGGEEALELCRSHGGSIHLLLTDVLMPGLNGIELAKKIVAQRESIRVLYMSGYLSDTLEETGMTRLEGVEFIQKPFGTAALVEKIRGILD